MDQKVILAEVLKSLERIEQVIVDASRSNSISESRSRHPMFGVK